MQIEYWDRIADTKTFSHPVSLKWLRPFMDSRNRILDYGCGYGRTCHELWQHGYRNVLGIDSSKEMIRRGRSKFPHLDLRLSCDTDLPRNAFSAILLFAVLTCTPTDEAQQAIIRHVSRLLCPGGVLYISDLLLQSDERNLKRYGEFQKLLGIYGVFKLKDGGIFRHHDLGWIATLTNGFSPSKYKAVDLVTMNGNPATGFQYLCEKR